VSGAPGSGGAPAAEYDLTRVRVRRAVLPSGTFETPGVWLGQSVRTSVISAAVPELQSAPLMVSLGDALARPRLLERVFNNKLRSHLGVTGPILLDSGGFTLLSQPEAGWSAVRIGEIYARADADVFVALDHPPGLGEPPEARQAKYLRSLRNLEVLLDCVPPHRLVPVIHGRTLTEVECNCAAVSRRMPVPFMIGLGGIVPLLRRSGAASVSDPASAKAFLIQAVRTVRRHFADTLIHVFGVGSPVTMLALFSCGADSVDSIGWRRAAGFGTIFLPGRSERFVADLRGRRRNSRPMIDEDDRELLSVCACPACATRPHTDDRVAVLSGHYVPRAVHNAWTLLNEAANLRRAASTKETWAEFIRVKLAQVWRD